VTLARTVDIFWAKGGYFQFCYILFCNLTISKYRKWKELIQFVLLSTVGVGLTVRIFSYVASTKETTLIGRISDIVLSGRGPDFVA